MDGALQLQPFMFRRSFVSQIIAPNEAGQPGFVAGPIRLAAHLIEPRVAWFNLFVLTIQVLIGVGLLYRRTVKPALLASFGWALGVWWIGEGLGGLLTGTASPLTGAPGAAVLYVFAGLLAWPVGRPTGIDGTHRARIAWGVLWLGFAALWLLPANRTTGAVTDAIANAPSGAGWLSSIHSTVATAAAGHGSTIALVAASLSAAVGLAVLVGCGARTALAVSVTVALIYWVIGQGIGGILTGSGTDPNTGPLLILLAISIYPIHRSSLPLRLPRRSAPPPQLSAGSRRSITSSSWGRSSPTGLTSKSSAPASLSSSSSSRT
jgi:hypothetical protein